MSSLNLSSINGEKMSTTTTNNRLIEKTEINITIKISIAALMIALGVVLSFLNPFKDIILFGAKINPFVHLINAIVGVLLGPLYGIFVALSIATIRYSLGIGTVLAFPGGIPGALIVGIFAKILRKKYADHPNKTKIILYAVFSETIGTALIGGTIANSVIPIYSVITWWWLFAASSFLGVFLAYGILLALSKSTLVKTLIDSE